MTRPKGACEHGSLRLNRQQWRVTCNDQFLYLGSDEADARRAYEEWAEADNGQHAPILEVATWTVAQWSLASDGGGGRDR